MPKGYHTELRKNYEKGFTGVIGGKMKSFF